MLTRDQLRHLADAATPGVWASGTPDDDAPETRAEWLRTCLLGPDEPAAGALWVVWVPDDEEVAGSRVVAVTGDGSHGEADARWVAAAQPAVVLALLDDLDAAEANAEEYRRLNAVFIESRDAAEAERDALTATLARIEAWARQIADRYDDAWEHTGTCLGDGGDSGACPLCLILAACGDRRIEDALDAEAGEPVTPEPPRAEVTTIEERDALPAGVVVRSAGGTIACRHHSGMGVAFGDERPFSWSALALPLTVLWAPGAEAGER